MNVSVAIGVSCTIFSFLFFVLCRILIYPLTFYRLTSETDKKISKPYVKTWFSCQNYKQWERLNLMISWLHSFIASLLVIYSFWAYSPDIYQDFVTHVTLITYLASSFSYGYFWYDFFDILSNKRGAGFWELLLHHIITLIFFSFNILSILNIGYLIFALLVEVNSIFLHARKLFHFYHVQRNHLIVRLNTYFNLLTFIFCRLCMLFFVTIFAYNDRFRIGHANSIFVLYILLPASWIINPILFYRVLHSDFLKNHNS